MAIQSQLTYNYNTRRLDTLVDDVLIHIFSILSVWDVLHVRQTSKRMEALSRVRTVWHALFARDVLKPGRPVPGFSFTPTPRLMQLFALDPAHASDEDMYHAEFAAERLDEARELIEASDLEARTVHALRLEKYWTTATVTDSTIPSYALLKNTADAESSGDSHLRTFHTPTPVRDVFLLPGGRFVVSAHADRLRCWDLGVPYVHSPPPPDSKKPRNSHAVRCVGEWILVPSTRDEKKMMIRMDAHAPRVYRRDSSSVCFALCSDIIPSWASASREPVRTCKILSVRLDPLRSSPFDLHQGLTGSPFASPVPFFRREAVVCLPSILPVPAYPENTNISDDSEWGPQRFARGKLGEMLCVYGSLMLFASYVPPATDGDDNEGPRYAGIEVLDWNEPTKSVLFEYPDPQVGPYVGMHVYASACQVLVVWQNCAGLYPIPFQVPAEALGSGGSSVVSSRPSSPSPSPSLVQAPPSAPTFLTPPLAIASSLQPDPSTSSCSSPGSSRSPEASGVDREEDIINGNGATSDPDGEIDADVKIDVHSRTVTMPSIVFALSEPVQAPLAFSACQSAESIDRIDNRDGEMGEEGGVFVPQPLTILARSLRQPTRNVQSVLTATPSPSSCSSSSSCSPYSASSATNPEAVTEKYTFRISRVPAPAPTGSGEESLESEGGGGIAALALGPSGRGVRADVGGSVYRCKRAEIVLPRFGYGFGFGLRGGGRGAVPTVDFWPWRRAAALPLPSPSLFVAAAGGGGAGAGERRRGEMEMEMVLRFDDGMGRVVAARVPSSSAEEFESTGTTTGTSEVVVLDFA